MNKTLIQLADRRNHLIAQTIAQRLVLAQNIEAWRMPLSRADQGLAALRYIKNHPVWIVGGSILLVVLRLGRARKLLTVMAASRPKS